MAYRFNFNEPIKQGVRRIGLEQLARAERELGATRDKNVAIHSARKSIKRVRALLRLVRQGMDAKVFRYENRKLRETSALLAPSRDQYVLLETALQLDAETHNIGSAGLAAVKRRLQEQALNDDDAHDDMHGMALSEFQAAQQRFSRLKVKPNNISILERGLERSYRQAVRAFRKAYETGEDEDFHEWRKGVQAHWRHMTLLSRAWPEVMDARAGAARELSQVLGYDHDLSMLIGHCQSSVGEKLAHLHVKEVVRLARNRQKELRREAALRGNVLFSETPRAHVQRIGANWRAAAALDRLGNASNNVDVKRTG